MFTDKIHCGLDIGSHRIKVAVIKQQSHKAAELLGVLEVRTHGYSKASVNDLAELSESIHDAVNSISRQLGVRIREVELGLSGDMVTSRIARTMIPLIDRGNKVITTRDMEKVNRDVKLLGIKMEEEILHDIYQGYLVDEDNCASNPIGLYGRKLGVEALLIVAQVNGIRNLTRAVHQAGYDINHVSLSCLMSSYVVLDEADRDEGCILIDMGAKATSILLFKDKRLRSLLTIDIGGDSFSKKIALDLSLPIELAEDIKKSYAAAQNNDEQKEEEILVKREDTYVPIKREKVCEAIQPEIASLVQGITRVIDDNGFNEHINRGITVVGGGAMLPGLIECIAQESGTHVRLGKIKRFNEKHILNASCFSSVTGLALRGIIDPSAAFISSQTDDHLWKRFSDRMRDLYQEYF